MTEQNTESNPKPTKGYGKRPIWQWVVLYLVMAIILYGLIYLIFFNSATSSSGAGY